MPRWKTFVRIYMWLSFLVMTTLIVMFYPVIRFARSGLAAATVPPPAAGEKEGPVARNIDPHSLLGVDPSMLPKFEGMVERGASNSAPAHLGMGLLYQYKGLNDDAERLFRRALK